MKIITTFILIFRELNKKFHQTFLIVTHDINFAQKSDRIIQLKDGEVVG